MAAWGDSETEPIQQCMTKLHVIETQREAALATLLEQQELYAKAMHDVRERQNALDELVKRHKKSEENLGKAEKKAEKAKPGPKKDEAEAEITAARNELDSLTAELANMTLTCERFKHQHVREASLHFSEALVEYHEECARLANKTQLLFAAIPDVTSVADDGSYVYAAVGGAEPGLAASVATGATGAAAAATATAAASASGSSPAAGRSAASSIMATSTLEGSAPNSFDRSLCVRCTCSGTGLASCGRYHMFAVNPTGSSLCRIDCACGSLISLDVRDATSLFFLGVGVVAVESDEVDEANCTRHAGPWRACAFLDDPWAEKWNEPTVERVRRAKGAEPPKRMQGTATRAYRARRADQVTLSAGCELIIADEVDATWLYGMVVGGDFGFIRRDCVQLGAVDDPFERMRTSSQSAGASAAES